MEKAIRPCPPESFGQDMERDQVEEVFSLDDSGPVFAAFDMAIAEGDHAVPAVENILLPDDAAVQVAASNFRSFCNCLKKRAMDDCVFANPTSLFLGPLFTQSDPLRELLETFLRLA